MSCKMFSFMQRGHKYILRLSSRTKDISTCGPLTSNILTDYVPSAISSNQEESDLWRNAEEKIFQRSFLLRSTNRLFSCSRVSLLATSLRVGIFLGLFFDPEDWDHVFLRNVRCISKDHMVLQ
jgi:hypothetical protein